MNPTISHTIIGIRGFDNIRQFLQLIFATNPHSKSRICACLTFAWLTRVVQPKRKSSFAQALAVFAIRVLIALRNANF